MPEVLKTPIILLQAVILSFVIVFTMECHLISDRHTTTLGINIDVYIQRIISGATFISVSGILDENDCFLSRINPRYAELSEIVSSTLFSLGGSTSYTLDFLVKSTNYSLLGFTQKPP